MTLSERIANCPKCKEYSKIISPTGADDLFQNAWLDVWNYEQREPKKANSVKYHSTYFYRVLRMNYINSQRKIKKDIIPIERVNEGKIIMDDSVDQIPPEAFLIEWMAQPPKDEIDLFYKNIITLVLRCKNTEDAIRMCNVKRTYFYKYLKIAKQKLKNDFILSTSNHNSHCNNMV